MKKENPGNRDRLGAEETESVLREAGHRMVTSSESKEGNIFEERLDQLLKNIEKLGGQVTIAREDGKIFVRSAGCPLSAVTADHGEICQMVETILSEIIGRSRPASLPTGGLAAVLF